MLENAISPSSLYSSGSTLDYAQAAMIGLSGSHGGLQDPQQLSYTGHGGIPDIILTGVCPHLPSPPQPALPPQLSPHSTPCTPLLTLCAGFQFSSSARESCHTWGPLFRTKLVTLQPSTLSFAVIWI